MKRFIFLCLSLVVAIGLSAQIYFKPDQTFARYDGVAADVIDAAENLDKVFVINKDYWYNYYIVVDADTNTDAANTAITVALAGSFDNTNYTTITSVTWNVSQDTIIYFSDTIGLTEATTETVAAYVIKDTTAAYVITDTISAFIAVTNDSMFEDEVVPNTDTISFAAQYHDYDVAQVVHDIDVAAQTTTITNTVTPGGVMYQFLRVRLTGTGAAAECELQSIDVKITRVPTK